MTDKLAKLRERLTAAIDEVSLAEEALDSALRNLGSGGPRAEKVAITADVSAAFTRLRRAHAELTGIRDLIEAD